MLKAKKYLQKICSGVHYFLADFKFLKLGVHCPLSYHSGNKVIPLFCSTSIVTASCLIFFLPFMW